MKNPMVASDVGGISGLIKNGETGYLFEAGNTDEFANKLNLLCENPESRKRMGENIYNLATTQFSSNTFAKTHLDIYKKIICDYNDDKRYDFLVSGYYGCLLFQKSSKSEKVTFVLRFCRQIRKKQNGYIK